ncbi:PIN domain-containing protein [Streptomyces sp. NPDC058892]|uniref:PIN domain-containing protein n=1 Tax=unclassified Streptomyces TaxID=2593676 RepID=UPI000A89D2C9|nr:PIN domain-containing protein [Streptomyces sp. PCS3-D2]WKV73192.1 PIN domain-containing protein [Streptomyces sp. PCS3-D2]
MREHLIRCGVRLSSGRSQTSEIQYRDRIAAVGEREALAYLALHRRLKSAGTSIDPPDALIAATALANGWTLVSRNIKHLARSGALLLNPWEYEG